MHRVSILKRLGISEMTMNASSDTSIAQPAHGVIAVTKLGAPPWPTLDPFLFCVHHNDDYPAGNADMALNPEQLEGRNIGTDFSGKDGWSMYHGDTTPGFPRHPHRGFETVTLARRGYIDHSDSLGATARFGQGDVQWMTAGAGIVHSEMFPLLESGVSNPTELFQIWLNLAAEDKLKPPHFTMFWSEDIPRVRIPSAPSSTAGDTEVVVIAGPSPLGQLAPEPPPASWASRAAAEVAIWTINLSSNATFQLPSASPGLNRVLYFFAGEAISVNGRTVTAGHAVQVQSDCEIELANTGEAAEILMLQGRPIGEPVAQHGPFVMNSNAEIRTAISDYQRSQFGAWQWPADGPVHARESGRFAQRPDGSIERP
jgi:quercetin 2,3-dioxygenase